ncbi:MAG: hypothetical protein KAW12_24740 [Candidatus Aminicenantes bacterium]|nr:hypothetical protein [Candidatus Aminicenantes bacterium]
MKIDKKTINAAVFFFILYWLLAYVLVFKKKLIFAELTAVHIGIVIAGSIVLVLLSKILCPVFELVLKVTGKIGTLIFALITTIVYIFILTPIAFYKKLRGPVLLQHKFDKEKTSYFEEWESSPNLEKQY